MSQNAFIAPEGPQGQIVYASADMGIPAATVLVGSGTVNGTLIQSRGVRELAVAGKSTHAGTLTLTTYLDAAGTIVVDTVTGTLVANVALTIEAPAQHPFVAWKVSITDTSTTTGTCQALAAVGQF